MIQPQSICAYLWSFLLLVLVGSAIAVSAFGAFSDFDNLAVPDEFVGLDPIVESPGSRMLVGLPERLVIPAIGVNARVQKVGLAASGNVGVPSNFKDVAWYRLGSRPGDPGSALVSGHVDNALGLAGVFKRLPDLRLGDEIFSIDESGQQARFKVKKITQMNYNATNTAELFTRSGPSRIALVTCIGSWIKSKKTYDQRLVVIAERV